MKVSLVLNPILLITIGTIISCKPPQDDPEGQTAEPETPREASATPSNPGDIILAKLEEIIIPVIDFEDTSLEEAIDYLRVRSMELDKEGDPNFRGISMLIHRSESPVDSPDGLDVLSIAEVKPGALRIARYQAKNISLLEALTETCRLAELDAYLTSVGIVICPKGTQPFPNSKARSGELWKKLTE